MTTADIITAILTLSAIAVCIWQLTRHVHKDNRAKPREEIWKNPMTPQECFERPDTTKPLSEENRLRMQQESGYFIPVVQDLPEVDKGGYPQTDYRLWWGQPIKASDNDIDHIDQAHQGPPRIPQGTATDYVTALSMAVRIAARYGNRHHIEIEHTIHGHRWRLLPREGEVELPRFDAITRVESHEDEEEDIYDAVASYRQAHPEPEFVHSQYINKLITSWKASGAMKNAKDVSDGYHTFQELYDMRLALTVATFKQYFLRWWSVNRPVGEREAPKCPIYRSRMHSDGTMFDGMFIVGLNTGLANLNRQITFHYHDEHWDKFSFAETLDKAPEWDGHTDKDVIERLLAL